MTVRWGDGGEAAERGATQLQHNTAKVLHLDTSCENLKTRQFVEAYNIHASWCIHFQNFMGLSEKTAIKIQTEVNFLG
jgi:hypothetical protein